MVVAKIPLLAIFSAVLLARGAAVKPVREHEQQGERMKQPRLSVRGLVVTFFVNHLGAVLLRKG